MRKSVTRTQVHWKKRQRLKRTVLASARVFSPNQPRRLQPTCNEARVWPSMQRPTARRSCSPLQLCLPRPPCSALSHATTVDTYRIRIGTRPSYPVEAAKPGGALGPDAGRPRPGRNQRRSTRLACAWAAGVSPLAVDVAVAAPRPGKAARESRVPQAYGRQYHFDVFTRSTRYTPTTEL